MLVMLIMGQLTNPTVNMDIQGTVEYARHGWNNWDSDW